MVRRANLEILIERLENALDRARQMELEHLQFLLSMAFMEARQQLAAVPAPLRLVVRNRSQG